MSTQADMKTRIALELRRDDITTDIANAISTAIAFYQYDRFPTFNTSSLQAPPASDSELNNPWMNIAEPLIRYRAKAILYNQVVKQPQLADAWLALAQETESKLKVSNLYQALGTFTLNSLGYMKAKIANEIERGDLINEIAAACLTAIQYYQKERFYFNETRDITFVTNPLQYLYTSADNPDLGNLIKVDYLFAYIGNQPYRIFPIMPEIMEWSHLSLNDPVGQPFRWTYFGGKFAIYPTPDQSYTIRLGGQRVTAPPVSDTDTSTAWTNDAEDMIRCRAKFELYTHIPQLANPEKAMEMRSLAEDAFNELKKRTNDLEQTADFIVEAWGY